MGYVILAEIISRTVGFNTISLMCRGGHKSVSIGKIRIEDVYILKC